MGATGKMDLVARPLDFRWGQIPDLTSQVVHAEYLGIYVGRLDFHDLFHMLPKHELTGKGSEGGRDTSVTTTGFGCWVSEHTIYLNFHHFETTLTINRKKGGGCPA